MNDEDQICTVRLMAADKILDRGFAKPNPLVNIESEDEVTGESDDDRSKREASLRKSLEKALDVKKKMLERGKRLNKKIDVT
jgi:low affinity Fe/Cu permease